MADVAAHYHRYRNQFGWPVGRTRRALWIRMTGQWHALAVPEAVARLMTVTEPAIVFPGTPVYHVFIVSGETSPTAGLDEQTAGLLRGHGIIVLPQGTLLDLPPTEVPREPMFWTSAGDLDMPATEALTWTVSPSPGAPPTQASTIVTAITDALRRDRRDKG